MLTPNEHLTGSTHQKREIYDRLARVRTDPRRTLRLVERYPHLTFDTLDAVAGALSGPDLDVFKGGAEKVRDRLAGLGQTSLLPLDRVFVAVSAATTEHGGFHGPSGSGPTASTAASTGSTSGASRDRPAPPATLKGL